MSRLVRLKGNVLIDLDDISYSYEEESGRGRVVLKSQGEDALLGAISYADLLKKVGEEEGV